MFVWYCWLLSLTTWSYPFYCCSCLLIFLVVNYSSIDYICKKKLSGYWFYSSYCCVWLLLNYQCFKRLVIPLCSFLLYKSFVIVPLLLSLLVIYSHWSVLAITGHELGPMLSNLHHLVMTILVGNDALTLTKMLLGFTTMVVPLIPNAITSSRY